MPYADPVKRKEYHKEYSKKWEGNNRDKRKLYQKKHDLKRNETPVRKKQLSDVRYRRHHRNKVYVLEKYGTECTYCGEKRYELLVCDHINNDGARHRETQEYKRFNCGGMYGYLAKTEYRPDLYQILCHNCNAAKQYYGISPDGNEYKDLEYWKELSKLRRKENAK